MKKIISVVALLFVLVAIPVVTTYASDGDVNADREAQIAEHQQFILEWYRAADFHTMYDGFRLFIGERRVWTPFISETDGVLYIPADVLFYNLGAISPWDSDDYRELSSLITQLPNRGEQTVFSLGGVTIEFFSHLPLIYVNGEPQYLENPAYIFVTMLVPFLEVAELINQNVEITEDDDGNTVFTLTPQTSFDEDTVTFLNMLNANAIVRHRRSGSLAPGGNIDYVGGMHPGLVNSRSARRSLYTYWNITDRDDVFEVIARLYASGHNIRYLTEHINEGTESPWGDSGLLGWDLGRVAQVASISFVAGYITMDEFVELSLPAAIILQMHFDSWEEFGENFVHGSAFWLGNRRGAEAQLRHRRLAHEEFVARHVRNIPPWDMDFSWAMDISMEILAKLHDIIYGFAVS